jgi:hypothetical protein
MLDYGCLPGRRSEADYHMAQDRAHVLAARIDEFINAQTSAATTPRPPHHS